METSEKFQLIDVVEIVKFSLERFGPNRKHAGLARHYFHPGFAPIEDFYSYLNDWSEEAPVVDECCGRVGIVHVLINFINLGQSSIQIVKNLNPFLTRCYVTKEMNYSLRSGIQKKFREEAKGGRVPNIKAYMKDYKKEVFQS